MDCLEALLDVLVEEAGPATPGVAVTVLGADRSWSGARGVDGGDCFRIASVTKAFVAASVLRLHEEGVVDVFAPLGPRLGEETAAVLSAAGYDLGLLTPLHLLGHTSGLPDHSSARAYREAVLADPARRWTPAEQVGLAVSLPAYGPAGGQCVYSDTGYVVLGGLLQAAIGLPLGLAVRSLLRFDELGLRQTWWEELEAPPSAVRPRMPQWAGDLDLRQVDPSMDLYGGGGLVSTTHDLARFAGALMRGEVLREAATLELMKDPGPPGREAGIGLGLFRLPGEGLWGHTGFWGVVMASTEDGLWSMGAVVTQAPAFGGVDPTAFPARFGGCTMGT